MMRHRRFCHRIAASAISCLAASLLLTGASLANSEKRVALVFGNSAYSNVPRLPNPAADGAAMAAMLQSAGFDVVTKQDASVADMRHMLRDFAVKVQDADVVVVFYAGHGIEIDGTNYLLPTDAKLERDTDVEDETISLDRVVRVLEPARKLRLVILDACRDNPFSTTMKRSLSRAVRRGLAKVEPTSPNTLIAYAAKAGSTASDGTGPDSPFTTALLKYLPMPGQDLRKSLGYVRDEVMKTTDNSQEPYVYGSLGGDDVVLVAGAAPAAIPGQIAALDPNSPLRRDYELAAQINTLAGWDAFLKSYASGFYADLARAARSKLTPTTLATAAPDNRNLSAIDANGSTSTPADAGLGNFVGRSFVLKFHLVEDEVSPQPGIKRTPREFAFYVKSPAEIASRITTIRDDPSKNSSRYATGGLGVLNRGIQVSFANGELLPIVATNNFRMRAAITSDGTSCRGSVTFELDPGSDHYELGRASNGEAVNARALSAERIACWVSRDDAVGSPPAVAAKKQ